MLIKKKQTIYLNIKYVIPNERLKSLITDRLNSLKDETKLSRIGTFIIIYNENDDVLNDYKEVIIEYDFSDGRLYVNEEIFNDLMYWFPIDPEDAKKFIIDWFKKTYDVDVNLLIHIFDIYYYG